VVALLGAGVLASGAIILAWMAGTPASRAVGVAVVAALVAVVQWHLILIGCWHQPVPEWDGDRTPIGTTLLFAGLIAVAFYPCAWALLTLLRHPRSRQPVTWHTFAALAVVLVALVIVLPLVELEEQVISVRWTRSDGAFRHLATMCRRNSVLCDDIPSFLGAPPTGGVIAAIAGDTAAPSDLIYDLAKSDHRAMPYALTNPHLSAAAFRDVSVLCDSTAQEFISQNSRMPAGVLDSLDCGSH
jgi:hypothetical protein